MACPIGKSVPLLYSSAIPRVPTPRMSLSGCQPPPTQEGGGWHSYSNWNAGATHVFPRFNNFKFRKIVPISALLCGRRLAPGYNFYNCATPAHRPVIQGWHPRKGRIAGATPLFWYMRGDWHSFSNRPDGLECREFENQQIERSRNPVETF